MNACCHPYSMLWSSPPFIHNTLQQQLQRWNGLYRPCSWFGKLGNFSLLSGSLASLLLLVVCLINPPCWPLCARRENKHGIVWVGPFSYIHNPAHRPKGFGHPFVSIESCANNEQGFLKKPNLDSIGSHVVLSFCSLAAISSCMNIYSLSLALLLYEYLYTYTWLSLTIGLNTTYYIPG